MPQESGNPIVIGLVGGIASGKSHVADRLVALGAAVIDADLLGHRVLERPLVVRQLTQLFGDQILHDSSTVDRTAIDRSRLAATVFGDDRAARDNLAQLESVVHPLIHAEMVRKLRLLNEADPPSPAVVLDAPLLLEAKWEPLCDVILFVDTPREIRLGRAVARGWSEAEFDRREASQMSLDAKRRAATDIVDGTAEAEQLDRELQRICDTGG